MTSTEDLIDLLASTTARCREGLWAKVIQDVQARNVLELGVWKGAFAEQMLHQCPNIARYYMLDPWQHLDHWNKPSNVDQQTFASIYAEALARTDFAHGRRIVLRGTTTEMIAQIPDESLDVAYIDGDHTLRGIAIDLIRTYPKVRPGGIVGGDDYTPSIWQHAANFEPTLVYPFAAYFAESQGAPLVVLPHDQFAIIKPSASGNHFRVIDTSRRYGERTLLSQLGKGG
jgi:predicted O-methyltransferase YrrM